MSYLLAQEAPAVRVSSLKGGVLAASRITRESAGHGLTDEHAQEDAYLLSFQARDYQGRLWLNGTELDFAGSRRGNFTLYDYSMRWRADLQSAFDCVNFHIPGAALKLLEEEIGSTPFENLDIAPGADVHDPIVAGIVGAIMPMFNSQSNNNQLLLDYVGTGLLVHLAESYGSARTAPVRRGGLTPQQLKRAKALIEANLSGQLTLHELSVECGLSPSYFAKAFKVSTGVTPHKWMAQLRIAKAADLLKTSTISLAEIASKCGFADQAHFTRAFGEAKGVTPSAWRKETHPLLYPLRRLPSTLMRKDVDFLKNR